MRNLTNEERMEALRNAGIDTDKYEFSEIIVLAPKVSEIVEDKQLDNKKLFRRWVTAQTFRMLGGTSWDCSRNGRCRQETGWDAYLRNNYKYQYQFDMMLDELKVLSKLEIKDREAFEERSRFFTKEVIVATCNDYFYKLAKYVDEHTDVEIKNRGDKFKTVSHHTKMVTVPYYAKMKLSDFNEKFVVKPKELIDVMTRARTYAEMYTLLKLFMSSMIELPRYTPKCTEWKNTFKGIGGYETLKNLILFHDVKLDGCANKDASMRLLTSCLDTYKGEYWRFHYMLKKTIEINNFNLRESIIAHNNK